VSNEDEELFAVEESSHVGHTYPDTNQRLYGRQQISFTVCDVTILKIILTTLDFCLTILYGF